jgi:hypothetical protein
MFVSAASCYIRTPPEMWRATFNVLGRILGPNKTARYKKKRMINQEANCPQLLIYLSPRRLKPGCERVTDRERGRETKQPQ